MITHPAVEAYLNDLHPHNDPILEEMENLGTNINFPILGPLVGAILYQYTLVIEAKRILELGSGFGYSAYWFALGLPEDGMIICTDFSAKNKEQAENYFKRAGIDHKIEFIIGDAMEVLTELEGEFDIILNDIQKKNYPYVFEPAIQKLRKGGLLITDNVLRKGQVAENTADESIQAVKEYNKKMFESKKVVSSILPIRDGVGVCVKK